MAENPKPTKLKTPIKKQDQNKDWENKIQAAKEKKDQQTPPPAPEPAPPVQEPVNENKQENNEDFSSYFSTTAGINRIDNPSYEPTEEEKKREEACLADKDADASTLLHDILGCGTDINSAIDEINAIRETNKDLSKEEIEANSEFKKILEWSAYLRAALEDSDTFGGQKKLLNNMIDALNRHEIYLHKLEKQLSIAKITSDLSGKPKIYKGNEAIQLINNRYRGVYKVQLPNSGFWIKITPLAPVNMDAWIHEVDFGYKQFGRLIGGHFYLAFGIYLKQKLADLLKPNVVVDSNLAGWKEGTTLVDSISIHDYDTLCWAFSTIMHKNGVSIATTCTNPECKYHSTKQFVDLARCSYTNSEVLTKEAIQYLIEGNAPGVIRTKDQLKDYRTKLLKNRKFITFRGNDQLELVEPTLGEYIRTGMKILGKMAASVKDGKLDITDENVQRQAAFQLSSMLASWVRSIVLKNDKGEVQAIIDDPEVIPYQLETIMSEQNNFMQQLEEFMTNSKATFYAYVNAKCPKCGRQPDILKDNFVAIDMEYVLFCLSYLKLEQIGKTY